MSSLEPSLAVLRITRYILIYSASEREGRREGEKREAIINSLSLSLSLMLRYAFSLEETNERQYAEELCWESLTLQPVNPWASHTMGKWEY